MKPYVITGGPCVGKTTTIDLLQKRGFSVVPEASRMIIEEEMQKNSDIVPWKNIGSFQSKVADKQIQLEANECTQTTFLDRGLIDGYAYCVLGKTSIPETIMLNGKNRYSKVFFLEQLPMYSTDAARVEDPQFALTIHDEIKKSYETYGYELICVPPLSPEERVDFILRHIS